MASRNSQHGTICWLEIPAVSTARAAAFYTAVLGWECEILLPHSTVYMFRMRSRASSSDDDKMRGIEGPAGAGVAMAADETAFHGAFQQVTEVLSPWDGAPPVRPAVVLAHFAVESIEATLESVERMGGSTHQPKTPVGGNMGYYARFVDCEGNLQGIQAPN